jgi:CheY-like chemotaxis protein
MAGGIAHDFNNLLTVINGHCQLAIAKNKTQPEDIEQDLEAINTAGQKAAGLTKQMLAFSRKQVYSPQILNPNLNIIELERMFRRMISEDIDIQLKLDQSMGTYIKADPSQLEQIAINLMINARDAIEAKKEHTLPKQITIETSIKSINKSEAEQISECEPGDYFVLIVSDSGIGMTEEIRHNIFEPFYTTKEQGTGLGLSMVYGIVKQNKGFVNIYSESNIGTTFKIYWPVTLEKNKSNSKEDSTESLKGKETILLVEDEDQVLEFISTVLKKYGYKIMTASNGKSAEIAYQEHRSDIDMVITDLIMPEMNGVELAKKIKSLDNSTRIIFISGYSDDHLSNTDIIDPQINFLQKPFSASDLLRKIRAVLETAMN